MATIIHVQTVFPAVSGIPRDEAMNTWTFLSAAGDGSNTSAAALLDTVEPSLQAFYNTVQPSGFSLAHYISENRSRAANAAKSKAYNITAHPNGSPAGPPVKETSWTLAEGADGIAVPNEVSVVLSFHGTDTSIPEFGPGTRPRSRHRGRVFIGPLDHAVLAYSAPTFEPFPSAAMRGTLLDAADGLLSALPANWVVWSRANAQVYPVVGGWVDDAFDTQRRRGNEPTSRATFGVV